MINVIRTFVTTRRLIQTGDRIVAAVSGGADSVAMLCVLNELKSEMGFELSVCHLNHQLRGEESDGDEAYVRSLAEKMNTSIYIERQDVKDFQKTRGGSLEEMARCVRYEFFERASSHFNANKIALAHHRDDQCETVVFNLIRGSSIHGLRGMPAIRNLQSRSKVKIIRPMLAVSKTDLEDYLKIINIGWREDRTNNELQASRNIIRHKVLPAMAEVSESVKDHLLVLAEQASELEEMLTSQAEMILRAGKQDERSIRIETWRIETLPKLIASEVVRLMIVRLGAGLADFTAEHFNNIASLSKRRMNLPGGFQARQEHGWLIIGRFETKSENELKQVEKLPINGSCIFGRFEFSTSTSEYNISVFKEFIRNKSRYEEWIDADKICGELQVRFAHDGERFWPLGSSGSKKVGDFLTDVKAGFSARPAIVVADCNGIIWLAGRRVDNRVRIDERTKNILMIKYIDRRQE
jgi:tRNA(Ile)-lysidine synthase